MSPELSQWLSGKEPACHARDVAGVGDSIPGLGRFPWRRKWQPTPVFLPGESPGQRSLVGYSPWGRKRVRHDLGTKNNKNLSPHSSQGIKNVWQWHSAEMDLPSQSLRNLLGWWTLCPWRNPPPLAPTWSSGHLQNHLYAEHPFLWPVFILTPTSRKSCDGTGTGNRGSYKVTEITGLFEEKIKRDPKEGMWYFPGGPVVKALPSNAVVSIPDQGTKISWSSWPKNRT